MESKETIVKALQGDLALAQQQSSVWQRKVIEIEAQLQLIQTLLNEYELVRKTDEEQRS